MASLSKTVGGLSAKGVRHLFGIKDLSPAEFVSAVRQASALKTTFSSPSAAPESRRAERDLLLGRTVAMVFNKLSTRTRVSTEVAVNLFGGHPMFLGKNDIQLGVSWAF
jgi:ornithine carbamoyltransferase